MSVSPPSPLLTARQLIAVHGRHLGSLRACGCCGAHSLYLVVYPDNVQLLLCSRCDVADG